MRSRLPKNDGRLRVWIPEEDRWIRSALEERMSVRERSLGVPSSVSNEAYLVLKQALEKKYGPKTKEVVADSVQGEG